MKKITTIGLLLATLVYSCNQSKEQANMDYTQYVDPFIGTADNGHTFPGACAPFGMIQATPQSGNGKWKYCSGYNYEDTSLQGFVQSCLNGTGVPDLGDILMFPFSGAIEDYKFESAFDKKSEKAKPGYYAVTLSDFDVDVELTATAHTAFHRYTFNRDEPARIYIDLLSALWDKSDSSPEARTIQQGEVQMPNDRTIIGHNIMKAWVKRQIFYAIEFDKPYRVVEELAQAQNRLTRKYVLEFDLELGESVQAKVALSAVSLEGAQVSLKQENSGWDFNKVRAETQQEWNKLLSRAEVTGTNDEKVNFYTSMYHLFIQPNNVADLDGQYRGVDDNVYTSSTGEYYSTLSLWDTYRAAHPLYTIITPEKVNHFVQTMLDHHEVQGYLPIWALWGKENQCMIGNHAIPVIVDAYLKGFDGFDPQLAYDAIKTTSMVSHSKSNWETYNKYGYYPFDLVKEESVSRTLESGYDDYCVAQMAQQLGKTEDYEYFSNRASFYKNLFDNETKLMRGKDANGEWRKPFNIFSLSHAGSAGGDYTEGNAWQYTWHVQHEPEALIEMIGSKENFVTKLDSLFFLDTRAESTGFVGDVTGLIGQYAHGNEPSHHVAYLYNYADRKDKTQGLIREIFDRFYIPKPDGLCGNDDCGQMSAWYIFSAMGFYPVNPCGGEYVLGAPQIPKIVLSLSDNKTFTVEAKNLSRANKYVKSVELNGKLIDGISIHHKDIVSGGSLIFTMTDIPQK